MKTRLKTTAQFIEEARSIHGNTYDYSKSIYVYSTQRMIVICPIHGEVLISPSKHLDSCGCPDCGRKLSAENRRVRR